MVEDRSVIRPGETPPAQDIGKCAECRVPGKRKSRAGSHGGVEVGDRGEGDSGTVEFPQVAGDEADQRPAVWGREETERVGCDGLIARVAELDLSGQIDPELYAVNQSALPEQALGRQLVVED